MVTAGITLANEYKLASGHANTVTGWNGADLVIRNPWGSNKYGNKELRGYGKQDPYITGVFVMTLDEFDATFAKIAYEEG